MGRRHARIFASIDSFELAAVFDPRRESASSVVADFGGAVVDDESSAIARADVVVIATPSAAHHDVALAAIDAGRHVLVEKPICERAIDARHLVDAAARAQTILAVGHSERFNPVICALKSCTKPAEIESIASRRVALTSQAREHGVLLNLGIHDLDLASYLTRSRVTLVRAEGSIGEHDARLFLRTASGAHVQLDVDRLARERERTIVVATRDAIFEGDLLAPSLTRVDRATGIRSTLALNLTEPLFLQATAFAEVIARGPSAMAGSRVATGDDGLRAVDIAFRAARQIRAKNTPKIKPHSISDPSPMDRVARLGRTPTLA
jgi:UDP-N-acetylglucosamine 3-dehydrogenase